MTTATLRSARGFDLGVAKAWPLWLGFAALALPTLFTLAQQSWPREDGAHGPIILAAGGWLLARELPQLRERAAPAPLWLALGLMVPALAAYVFGRAFDLLTLQVGGLYGAGLAILLAKFGPKALLGVWFPVFYLTFAIPPPGELMSSMTTPLKHFVSFVVSGGLGALGLPVAREGVTLIVAQYQLLVEDACSGMNSLFGLTAISLLYVYLRRGSSLAYSLVLCAFITPVAVAANVIRVAILVLLTYFFGDAVAQSFLHVTAGLLLFVTALSLVFAIDQGLERLWPKISARS